MNLRRVLSGSLLALSILLIAGCDSFLEPKVHSELAPENYLSTEEGIQSTLGSAYHFLMYGFGTAKYRTLHTSEWSTDIAWQTGGGENRMASLMINFQWDPSNNMAIMWNRPYNAIRDANTVLDNLENVDVSEQKRTQLEAEARFIRAGAYRDLQKWFGPVPLRTSLEDPLELARASEEEMDRFIEQEFKFAIENLPQPGNQPAYGRAHKAAARGWLAKWYLNQKMWQKAADMAKELMDQHNYELYTDTSSGNPAYFELFQVENERNNEFIWVDTMSPQGPGNPHMNQAFPWGFQSHPRTGLQMQPNWNNWASQSRLRDAFVNSFDPDDERQSLIVKEYVNAQGDTVDLMNDFKDATRAFKYWPDPNAQGNQHGNDLPRVRFADILLIRAEALNEINNGPTQEAIDLVNRVRRRAGLTGDDQLQLSDFSSAQEFRNHLADERAWELYYEGFRREDLIRMGKYIDKAKARGKNAQPHHRLYPIPAFAMEANPKLEQNPGYGGS